MRSANELLAAVERALPGLTLREWAVIAAGAAGRAGLEEPELTDLRRGLALARRGAEGR